MSGELIVKYDNDCERGMVDMEASFFADHAGVEFRYDLMDCNIDVCSIEMIARVADEYDYKDFQLLLLLYVCRRWEGVPMSMENNELKWVKPNMLRKFKMPPADDSLIYCVQDLF